MLHIVKITNLPIRRSHVFSIVIAVVLVLLPASAEAQCSEQWDASGVWEIRLDYGAVVRVDLTQTGETLSGTATRWGDRTDGAPRGMLTAKATGDARSNTFALRAEWQDGYRARFVGRILASGRAEGGVYLGSSSKPELSWYSEQPLTCGWRSGKSRGNLTPRIPGNAPVKTSGIERSRPTTPFITASQPIVTHPTVPLASVYLGWDGGPDHPNVEVWLSMDNGAEIPAFSIEQGPQSPVWKQPKIASIPLQLQRNHHYKFVLKAAGKTLSTAAFVVP